MVAPDLKISDNCCWSYFPCSFVFVMSLNRRADEVFRIKVDHSGIPDVGSHPPNVARALPVNSNLLAPVSIAHLFAIVEVLRGVSMLQFLQTEKVALDVTRLCFDFFEF